MRKKERKTAPPETVLNASENESGQSKLVALSFSILLLVALLIWVFITLWFSGGNFMRFHTTTHPKNPASRC